MHVFKDRTNREWNIDVNVTAISRVRAMLKVDLMDLLNGPAMIDDLIGDPCKLVNVLYVICKPQADAAGVTDEAFGEAMAGDCVEHATTALLEDFVDFFPSRKREILRSALAKLKEIESGILTMAEKQINGPELAQAMATGLQALGN